MCKNLQYYFESVHFKELHKDQSYNWPTTYGAGAAVVSTITSVNTELSSLRKQPTFGGATTCFPANSWHVRNERRNSILMTHHHPDLGCPSDWLKQVSYRGTTNQRPTQIWVVSVISMEFCAHFSDVISRGNQRWCHEMSAIFSSFNLGYL